MVKWIWIPMSKYFDGIHATKHFQKKIDTGRAIQLHVLIDPNQNYFPWEDLVLVPNAQTRYVILRWSVTTVTTAEALYSRNR